MYDIFFCGTQIKKQFWLPLTSIEWTKNTAKFLIFFGDLEIECRLVYLWKLVIVYISVLT